MPAGSAGRKEEEQREKRSCDCDACKNVQSKSKSTHHSSPPPHQHQHQHQRFLRLSARTIDTIHHRQVSYHFWIVALHCHYYHFSISVGVGSGTGELHRIKRVVASLLLSGMLLVDMNMNMNHES